MDLPAIGALFLLTVTISGAACSSGGLARGHVGDDSGASSDGGLAGTGGSGLGGSTGRSDSGTDDAQLDVSINDALSAGGASGGDARPAATGGSGLGGGAGRSDSGTDDGGGADKADGNSMVTGTIDIVSDTSWLTYGTNMGEDPPTGWNTLAFDDSLWVASIAPNPGACATYNPIQSWERVNKPMWDIANKYSAFFRKIVTLPDSATINYAKITSFADDDIAIWVNGSAVFVEADFGVVEGGIIAPHEIDLKPFLSPGTNLVAIHAQDTVGGGCRWAIVSGSLEEMHPAP